MGMLMRKWAQRYGELKDLAALRDEVARLKAHIEEIEAGRASDVLALMDATDHEVSCYPCREYGFDKDEPNDPEFTAGCREAARTIRRIRAEYGWKREQNQFFADRAGYVARRPLL